MNNGKNRIIDKTDYRNALDSVRLAIELLVRNVTGKAASLENQKKI